eukprot:6082623-Prymnesium_polylepis.1
MFEKRMFATFAKEAEPPKRGSDMHASTFERMAMLCDNLELGREGRMKHEERLAQKAAADEEHLKKLAERVASDRKLRQSIKTSREIVHDQKVRSRQEHQQQRQAWDEQRTADYAEGLDAMRKHVRERAAMVAKMDKAEADQDAAERAEATSTKQAHRELLEQKSQERLAAKRAV